MSPDSFERQIEAVRRRLAELEERALGPADQRVLLLESLEELSATLEELHVAAEELRHQNDELAAARQAVEAERQRYQDLFEFAPDGYLVTDHDGVIREANRAAASLLGVQPEFLVGKPLSVFVSEEDQKSFYGGLSQFRSATDAKEDWQLRLQPRDRTPFPASLTVGSVRQPEGGLTGLRWLIRDITERKEAEQELRSARDQLRALAARRETAHEDERSSIARESREELAQVLAALKIELTRLADLQPKELPTLRERTRGLLALVDGALKSALQIASDLRPGPLDDLGLMASIAWEAQAFQRRTGIQCHLISRLEDIPLDREQRTALYRIFQEALSNVERHTGVTRIRVELQVEGQGFILAVGDDGKRSAEGEGAVRESLLVLSIRERAHLLGGSVSIVGPPGGGTTVRVRIPLGCDEGTGTEGVPEKVSP